jgi:hypothetical protein
LPSYARVRARETAPAGAQRLTIDCVGSRLTGYLDGVRLFDVEDESHVAGRVGLYAWSNSAAQFSEVRVSAPVWTRYYAFADEEPQAAGTRLRVYGGSEAEAPPQQAAIEPRFVAVFDDRGRLRLPPSGTDLRVVEPDGEPAHARGFLSDVAYAAVTQSSLRVLRKADGTAFFLLRAATGTAPLTAFAPGHYRLAFAYLRDNTAADPASLVLSQAGDRSPEVVALDLPRRTR